MDAATILRALSIKRYVKQKSGDDIMVCVQLMRPENKLHYAACGQVPVHTLNDSEDQVVCIDEIKMTLLAKTCLCPGMTALICNLITSDDDLSEEADSSNASPKWFEEYRHGCGYEILPHKNIEHLQAYLFAPSPTLYTMS